MIRFAKTVFVLCVLPLGLLALWAVLKLDEQSDRESDGATRARSAGL